MKSAREVYAAKPDWVIRQISRRESAILSRMIQSTGATVGAEIGVASGFSSAMIFSALAENTATPRLHSFDIATELYFDTSRLTGDAFYEIHGRPEGWTLKTGLTSADIGELEPLDFIFIDANHATPWPALDLLSLGRFLKPGGWIALDDVEMPLIEKWKAGGKNGARDMFRAWLGKKTRYRGATGLAILEKCTPRVIAKSVADSMRLDWDEPLTDEQVAQFVAIAGHYGDDLAYRIELVIKSRRETYKAWRPRRPAPDYLDLPRRESEVVEASAPTHD